MLKTTVVLVRAAESEDDNRTLSHLGQLQIDWFMEAAARNGICGFDQIFAAASEADSWLTALRVSEAMHSPAPMFLKELSFPDQSSPRGAEIANLLRRFPDSPMVTHMSDPCYQALYSQTIRALRELRPKVNVKIPQRILICSRHGQALSSLALHWVSEMVFAGFKLQSHLAIPLGRGDFCFAATEFTLKNAESLMFHFDASDATEYAVSSIRYVACASSVPA